MGEGGHVSSPEDQAVPARQDHGPRSNLAAHLRRNAARCHTSSHAERDAGAAGRTSLASEWLVARYRAAASRAEAGPISSSRASGPGANVEESSRSLPRVVDAGGPQRAERAADARGARRSRSTRANSGTAGQRVTVQG